MMTFEECDRCFADNEIARLCDCPEGLLWLELKSIDRPEFLGRFAATIGYVCEADGNDALRKGLFGKITSNLEGGKRSLDDFILTESSKERERIAQERDGIIANLYKLQSFVWGGDYRNSLDKALVSDYVKTESIVPYEKLLAACDGRIREMSQRYVFNSWYNYWSSVLTEWIFKAHAKVLPTIGKIKNVDFFIDGMPFDLKVTYLPKEYSRKVVKEQHLPDDYKLLKSFAKKFEIIFDKTASESDIRYGIEAQLQDRKNAGDSNAADALAKIMSARRQLVSTVLGAPRNMIQWLYENQGEMRFGAENRIFVVLIDTECPAEAWKLKRNIELLRPAITGYLDSFDRSSIETKRLRFAYKQRVYDTYSDIIFVTKGQP